MCSHNTTQLTFQRKSLEILVFLSHFPIMCFLLFNYMWLFSEIKTDITFLRFVKGDITLSAVAAEVVYVCLCVMHPVVVSTHQWITTVTNTLRWRRPLAGWVLLMRMWSELSTLAPQQHTSLHHTTRLPGNSTLEAAGDWWRPFELMVSILLSVHGVLAEPQLTTTTKPRTERFFPNKLWKN